MVLSNLETEPFMNVEVVLRVFYVLGEVITDKVRLHHQYISLLHTMLAYIHLLAKIVGSLHMSNL